MAMRREIWNMLVVTVILMLINAAFNPAASLLSTALEDSHSTLNSADGYWSQSIVSLVSIVGALVALPTRMLLGVRLTIMLSGSLHAAFYLGALLLSTPALLIGSVASGVGMGIIWVVVPNYVTTISRRENIERNLAYHTFLYNLNGITGNFVTYFVLDSVTEVTETARLTFYLACALSTLVVSILGGCLILPLTEHSALDLASTHLTKDTDKLLEESRISTDDSEKDETWREYLDRWINFLLEPGVLALSICNVYFGAVLTLYIIIPMCISSTFDNRKLIPVFGTTVGVCRMLFTGVFEGAARFTSYRTTTLLCTLAAVSWATLTLLVFPNHAHQTLVEGEPPFLPLGDWVVYLIAVVAGLTITWLGVLAMIATGKVSRDLAAMHGFQSDVLFSLGMIVWSLGNGAVLALVPYLSLQLFCGVFLAGAIANHIFFTRDLLPFIREKGAPLE